MRILLALDENQASTNTYDDYAYYLGVSKPTICNVVKCYALEGIDKVLVRNRNINSDNVNRKIDGALEARIIAMACGNPPEGYARWTVKLLTEKARVELDLSAGEVAVRRMLKKQTASSQENLLVHSAKAGCRFHRPYGRCDRCL